MQSAGSLAISKIECHVVHSQDTTTGMKGQPNVGGHSGYFVLVHVETREGVDGWGECATGSDYGEGAFAAREIINRGFAPRLLGKNPLEIRKLWQLLFASTDNYGRRDLGLLALSGVDTALMDIAGKKFDVPACILLGGQFRSEIPLYASLLFDMDDPKGTAEKARPYVSERYYGVKFGWGMIPSKPFGADLAKDREMVSYLRNQLGPKIKIMVDVGRYVNLSASRALELARSIAPYDIMWLEEPLPRDDFEGYCQLRVASPVPIAAGESFRGIKDFKRAVSTREVDLFQPDASKAGGLSETKQIVDLIHSSNMDWVPHNWSTGINTAATAQLVASTPDGWLMEYKREPNPMVTKLIKNSEHVFRVRDGRLQVSSEPGLGINVDEDVISEFKVE